MEVKVYDDLKIFRRHTYSFTENAVTVLVGRNGWGKSTLLKELKDVLSGDKYSKENYIIDYNNVTSGGASARQRALERGNTDFVMNSMTSSEGENICLCLGEILARIGNWGREVVSGEREKKNLWIFLDGIDSGLSIDTMHLIRKDFLDLVIEDYKSKGLAVYIVISANQYEMFKDYDCINVRTNTHKTFKDYDSYREFILKQG